VSVIETMFDGVAWVALPPQEPRDGLPVATHEGVLDLGGAKLRVVQLSTGQRIIDADDLVAFFASALE
jgi:hypothetical protein